MQIASPPRYFNCSYRE